MIRSLYTNGLVAAAVAAAVVPGSASAFHDEARKEVQLAKVCCPTIVGSCYGFHPTRWRVMGPCTDETGRPCAATLSPVTIPTSPPMTLPPTDLIPKAKEPAPKVKGPDPIPKVKEPDPIPKAKEKMKVGVDKTGPAPFKLILPPDVASTVVVPPLPTGYGLRTEIPTVKKAGDFAESRDPR